MKILVISGGNNQYSLGRFYSDAFKKLGHEVIEYYDLYEMEKKSFLFKYKIFRKINWWRLQIECSRETLQKTCVHFFKRSMNKAESQSNIELVKLCSRFKPDILFVIVGRTIRKETLIEIKRRLNCILVAYNGDSYDNMHSTSKNMLETLPLFDIVFTWSYELFKPLYRLGVKRVEYLAFAYDENTHRLASILPSDFEKYGHEVVFVGTWDKEREELLGQLTDYDLGIWGPGWNKVSKNNLKNYIVSSHNINAYEMSKIYQTSKICMNIMRPQNIGSHNMKTFEIPALGGFMIANRSPDHLRIFSEGDDITCFADLTELKDKIDKYVVDDKNRMRIVKNAQNKLKEAHSYLQRAIQILYYINNGTV